MIWAMRVAPEVNLTDEERALLKRMSRGRTTPARLVLRARLVLAAPDGALNKDIAAQLGTGRKVVNRWRRRFVEGRVAALEKDRPRAAPPGIPEAKVREVLQETVTTTTPEG